MSAVAPPPGPDLRAARRVALAVVLTILSGGWFLLVGLGK